MKHVIYTITLILFTSFAFAQQPIRPLITKHTATWCPSCGGWGWDAMKDLVNDFHGESATVLALHFSGDLTDDLNKALAANFPAVGQPIFMVDGVDKDLTSSSWESKLADLKLELDGEASMINQFEVTSTSYLSNGEDGDIIRMTMEYDISNLPVGEYSVGAYLVRDNVVANQAGLGSSVTHYKILDGSFTEDPFGTPISELEGGLDFSHAVASELNFEDYLGQEVVIVLWNKLNESYQSITTHSLSIEDLVSNTEAINQTILTYHTYQNGFGDIQFEVNNSDKLNGESVSIYTVTGRKLVTQSITNNKAIFSQDNLNGKGIYLVRLESNKVSKTFKVLVK